MSNEKLIRMYSEELEYLCGKFRNHHIYVYPKDELYRSKQSWVRVPSSPPFIECEVDLGLLLVHVVKKPGDDICSPGAWTETNRYVVLRFPKVGRKKQKENELDHKFEVYRLSNVSAISMYVGTEE